MEVYIKDLGLKAKDREKEYIMKRTQTHIIGEIGKMAKSMAMEY